jgi:cyanophycinase
MLLHLAALVALKPGAIMLVGGGTTTAAMVDRFSQLCGGKDAQIVILGQVHEEVTRAEDSAKMLAKRGCKNTITITNREFSQADKEALAMRLSNAKGVWIPGGNQNLFVKALGADWCQDTFPKLVERGLNWFGTSAGAMLISNPMIGGSNPDGSANLTPGIGLADVLVDTHYRVRHRENRLRNAFFSLRNEMGIGLDEGEWVILRNGIIEDKLGEPHILLRERSGL